MIRIANGLIIDGTGKPAFVGDILIDGERIVEVKRKSEKGESAEDAFQPGDDTIVDATGCLVTPGFIDAHSHSDAYLVLEPGAPSKITQGITTEVNGQCGGSIAPRYGEARLSSDWATLLGEKLTWRSLGEYRAVLNDAKPAINTVQFIGHNTLRSSVVGYAGRAATLDEQKTMERLLAEALDEGGWGLTTGLIYQPGKYATNEEVTLLAQVAAKKGGLYATHMRSEGDTILESIDEVIALCERTGIRAEISHLKTSGKKNWGKIDAVLKKIEAGMAKGLLLGSDRYPFTLAGTDLDIVLPDWAQEGGCPAEVGRLKDEGVRKRIVDELNAQDRDWSTVTIGGTWSEETKMYSGKTVAEIGGNPGEIVCEILEADGCKTGAFFGWMCEENLKKILSRQWIVPGSDASLRAPWGPLGMDFPHPRAYATMPEFYAQVCALGVSREEAIARMTSVPARRFGIKGRGILEKGAFADVIVWKEDELKAKATYEKPHQFTEGIKKVFVNGVDSKIARAGRFLER